MGIYNKLLCKILKALYVEYWNTVKAMKYIIKYANKGSGVTIFAILKVSEMY